MHEIAHTDRSRAWTYAMVVYYGACERGNRIRAVVGCGRDLRRRRNAPSQSTSTRGDRETARGWDEKNDSVLFYFSSSHCSLSNPWLRWILLWCDVNLGRQRDIDRQRERRRYGADAAPQSGGTMWTQPMQQTECERADLMEVTVWVNVSTRGFIKPSGGPKLRNLLYNLCFLCIMQQTITWQLNYYFRQPETLLEYYLLQGLVSA